MTLWPLRQTYDAALHACSAKVALIGCNEYAVGSFQGDRVIISVEEMLLEFRRKLYSP